MGNELSGIAQSNCMFNATLRTRMNLALHHLFAACRSASSVRAVEDKNKGQPYGPFWDEILHYSLGTITSAAAALECYANEFYADGQAQGPHLNPVSSALFAELIDRQSVLDKYKFALAVRSAKRLDLGQNIVQNVDALIKLRNAIVHFQPEWLDERDKHERLSRQLEARFKKSIFLPNEHMFPQAWASGSCAVWAIQSVVNFIDYFCVEAGMSNPLQQFRERLTEYSCGAL